MSSSYQTFENINSKQVVEEIYNSFQEEIKSLNHAMDKKEYHPSKNHSEFKFEDCLNFHLQELQNNINEDGKASSTKLSKEIAKVKTKKSNSSNRLITEYFTGIKKQGISQIGKGIQTINSDRENVITINQV